MASVWSRFSLIAVPAAALASLLATAPATASTFSATALTYDDALLSQFNVVTLGNLTSNGATVDGRALVGGNYQTGSNTTAVCSVNCTGNATTAIDSSGTAYGATTVFGNVIGGLNSGNGDIDVKGNLSANTYNSNAKGALNFGGTSQAGTVSNAATAIRTTQASGATPGSITNPTVNEPVYYSQTMTQVFAPFGNSSTLQLNIKNAVTDLSRGIAALPGSPGVTAEALPSTSTATFFTSGTDYTYNGKSYGVVTTTFANLASQSSSFTGIKNGTGNAATVVIVTGDGANYLLPSLSLSDPNVIYDFVNATTLKFAGNFVGSILAPLATITQQAGTINGSIVVAAFTQTKELLSSDSFTGDLTGLTNIQFTAVPEPASLLLLGVGLGAVAIVRRRTRR